MAQVQMDLWHKVRHIGIISFHWDLSVDWKEREKIEIDREEERQFD